MADHGGDELRRGADVIAANVVGAILALGLLVYLFVALIRPEKF